MKKTLLILSLLITSLSAAWAQADLNPYAFGLKQLSYDDETKVLVVSYTLNAPADSVFINAVDAEGNSYQICHIGGRTEGYHEETLHLLHADDIDRLPRDVQLTWSVAAKGKYYDTHQNCGRKINFNAPFSISIDRNPNSPYFGRIITAQANNNHPDNGKTENPTKVGLYAYDARFQGGYRCIDPDVTLSNNKNWYQKTNLVPFRVRIVQDGSGRMLVSSASAGQPTYLWALMNPDDLNDWTPLIQTHQMKGYAPVGLVDPESDSMGNIDFDLKVDGDKLNVLLFGSSLNGSTVELNTGRALHSGIYTCNLSDFGAGTYHALTEDDREGGSPHSLVTNSNYLSFVSAHTAYDKYGGVWFCGYNTTAAGFADYSSLYHLVDGNAAVAQAYGDDSYLLRKNVGSASICYNKSFDRFAISQGNLTNEARIYDVTQVNGQHPVLRNGTSVNVVDYTASPRYVVDMCWDYADNLYVCLRNQDDAVQGVWVIAAALKGDTTTTVAPINKGNEFTMTCRNVQHQITVTSSIPVSCKIQNEDGTDFVDGLYDECSRITLKAVPSNEYKFLGWKKDGQLVSTDPTYSFYVTQATNIMAMFEYAVYNVEWYNLFQDGKDITTYIFDPTNSTDKNENGRLYYLFLAAYNSSPGVSLNEQTAPSGWKGLTVVQTTKESVYNYIKSESSPFKWLHDYIVDVAKSQSITTLETNAGQYSSHWRSNLHAFFNRVDVSKVFGGGGAYEWDGSKAKTADFTTAGLPQYWRPYWAEKACNLPSTITYNDALPIEWNRLTPNLDEYVTYDPRGWYKWNTVDAPQNGGNEHTHILAWRKGSATGEIKTCVDEDNLQLFATYVRKNIHENDPAEDLSQDPCDATNSDIFKLLYNKTWDAPWHKISITRKLQGGMFNTICLPFSVDLARDIPANSPLKKENAEFWEYEGTTSSYNQTGEDVTILNFTKVSSTGALRAGVPYLVKVDNDITDEYLYFGGELSHDGISVLCDTVPKVVSAQEGNPIPISFVGVINPEKNLPAGSLILVADSRLAITTETGRMEGMRGYFRIDPMWAADIAEQAADGRVYLSMKKPVTTSIPVAPEAEKQTKPEVRKIMRDGQIYILRGNEVYTITGHRVK